MPTVVDQLIPAATGSTVYALITAPDGTVWDTTANAGVGGLVAIGSSTRAHRAIALAEQQAGEGQFVFTMPAVPVNTRPYFVTAWIQSGGSPAQADSEVANLQFEWDGAKVVSFSSHNNGGQTTKLPATVLAGDCADAASIKSDYARRTDTLKATDASGNALATAASILNIQNNTFVSSNIPVTLERPDSGTDSVKITVLFTDETGTPSDIDASGTPTTTLINNAGTDLTSRLAAWAHPATGKYTTTYANGASDTLENIHWELTETVNGKVRRYVVTTQLVDTTAIDFTSADRIALNGLATTLGAAGAGLTNIPNSAGVGTLLNRIPGVVQPQTGDAYAATQALGSPMQSGAHVQLAAAQDEYAPAKAGAAMSLTTAYDAAKSAAAPGAKMDLIDAPNNVALTAIGNACSSAVSAVLAAIRAVTDRLATMLQGSSPSAFTALALANAPTGGGGGGGTGAYAVTVLITSDGTTPIVGASLRISGTQSATAISGTDGIASLHLDAGTVNLGISAAGYQRFTQSPLPTIDNAGHWTSNSSPQLTVTLTANPTVTPSSDPLTTTAFFTVRNSAGAAKPGVRFIFTLTGRQGATDGYDTLPRPQATSDVNGLVQVTLLRNATYTMSWRSGTSAGFPSGSDPTCPLPAITTTF